MTYSVSSQDEANLLSSAITELLPVQVERLQVVDAPGFDIRLSDLVLVRTSQYYLFRFLGGLIAGALLAWVIVTATKE